MKLPKLPAQWEGLDSFAKDRIDEASDQAAMFLVLAGYSSPQDLDENGEEIGNEVQSLLMDAMLRAPHLFLHITKLNELTLEVAEDPYEEGSILEPVPNREAELELAARQEFVEWAADATIGDLMGQRAASQRALDADEVGVAADEIAIVNAELTKRQAAADPEAVKQLSQEWGPWGSEGRQGL